MKTITTNEVLSKMRHREALKLIDVREAGEVAMGKIPGAINIPLGLLPFHLQELDKESEYVIVCRSGARSGRATEYLIYHGYKAMNMIGGMIDWNGPIEQENKLRGWA